jgi:hypothetical protein
MFRSGTFSSTSPRMILIKPPPVGGRRPGSAATWRVGRKMSPGRTFSAPAGTGAQASETVTGPDRFPRRRAAGAEASEMVTARDHFFGPPEDHAPRRDFGK